MTNTANVKTLALVNIHEFGHFLAYSANFTRWGLSRGLEVVHVGPRAAQGRLAERFADQEGVRVMDLVEFCPPGKEPASWEQDGQVAAWLVENWSDLSGALCQRFDPVCILFLNTDILLFNSALLDDGGFQCPGPAWGVATFGHREVYCGIAEPYTLRLRDFFEHGVGFKGMLTLDENQAMERDPEEKRLHFLPDPYRDFDLEEMRGHRQLGRAMLADITRFLEADSLPVIPLLGKFDRRKNPLYILRAVERFPQTRLVVLGERIADPLHDAEVDAILDRLEGQGRLFRCFGFVSEALFHAVFSSGRVPFVALPYVNHYGSSGIQLFAHEYGLPALVPDGGLMGMRVRTHDLGLVYRVGDEDHFQACFGQLLEAGPESWRAPLERFMVHFGEASFRSALDRAILGRGGGGAGGALSAFAAGPHRPTADEGEPGGKLRLGERAIIAGRAQAAADHWEQCLRGGLVEELRFVVWRMLGEAKMHFNIAPFEPGSLEFGVRILSGLLLALPGRERPVAADAGPVELMETLPNSRVLDAEGLQLLCDLVERAGWSEAAAVCRRRAQGFWADVQPAVVPVEAHSSPVVSSGTSQPSGHESCSTSTAQDTPRQERSRQGGSQ